MRGRDSFMRIDKNNFPFHVSKILIPHLRFSRIDQTGLDHFPARVFFKARTFRKRKTFKFVYLFLFI